MYALRNVSRKIQRIPGTVLSVLLRVNKRQEMRCISSTLQGLHVRESTAADYQPLMDLGPYLFDGKDWFPYTYHSLLSDPSWHSYVGEVDGKVVSFYGHNRIDGGRMLMSRGGRVAPHMQNRRIMQTIEQQALSLSLRRWPEAEICCGTVKSTSPWAKTYKEYNAELFRRGVVCYKHVPTSTSELHDPPSHITPFTKHRMSALFNNTQNSQQLFPSNRISVRWTCPSISDTNLDFIYRFSNGQYATICDESDDVKLLTLAVPLRTPSGFVYHMECYGDTSSETLLPHLLKHIHHAKQATPEGLDLYLYAYEWADRFSLDTILDTEMGKHGFSRYPLDYTFYLAGVRNITDTIAGRYWSGNTGLVDKTICNQSKS